MIQNYNFDTAYKGNTYDGVSFTLPSQNDFDLTGASIYMQLRKSAVDIVVAEFSTANSKLVVVSQYVFSLPSQIIDLEVGTYKYDILIIFTDGRRETYIGGQWIIQPLITVKP